MTDSARTVWVLQNECGDYYCGCGGGHIVQVFSAKPLGLKPTFPQTLTEIPLDEFKWNPERYENRAWT